MSENRESTPRGSGPGGGVGSTGDGVFRNDANRLGLDYVTEAKLLPTPPVPIIDIHAHINGPAAAAVWSRAAELYGVERVYSMSRFQDAQAVRETLGDRVRFIAFPDWSNPDKESVHRGGYLDIIRRYRERFGATVVKFWAAPALVDHAAGDPADLVEFDSYWRVKQAELATELGMMFMVHIADPDTWFRAKYTDVARYRRKPDHYVSFERMLDRFPQPWIAAHMGGSAEDLDFLDGLLERHDNLYLDTSATKWVVRALGGHPVDRVVRFFTRWRGRVLFGSDIVTMDDHLSVKKTNTISVKSGQASTEAEAFDLYASRYWALRAMFETGYAGESPVVDPDLHMLEPERHGEKAAPSLTGLALPRELLTDLYRTTAESVVEGFAAAR
ncbi:MAG: amidohydrolase family protein [Phycisphaerales bacterium JB041]